MCNYEPMLVMDSQRVHWLLSCLLAHYGPQHWWPGHDPFEIMVGSVLTQNTSWSNVTKAIARLVAADALAPERMLNMPIAELGELIRPAGFFNVKARRLSNLCQFVLSTGGLHALEQWETSKLREALLKVNGIGPETADDILLYAQNRPVFVVDSYTRRIGSRLGLFDAMASYEDIRAAFQSVTGWGCTQFNELHALLVQHAKMACRKRPQCPDCCLAEGCPRVGVTSHVYAPRV